MSSYQGNIAIVTGGASGIGRSLCRQLGALGAITIVVDLNASGAEAVATEITAAGGTAHARTVDVTNADAVAGLIDEVRTEHGRLDYMFNNAGMIVMGDYRDITMDHWRRIIDLNLWGVVHGCHAAYQVMAEQGCGHIVNTASVAGLIPTATLLPYTTTKHGIVGFSQSLRLQGRALGIRVTTVCPGIIRTGLVQAALAPALEKDQVERKLPKTIGPDRAAEVILRAVQRNRNLVVFPWPYRILWWAYRLAPGLGTLLGRPAMRKLRKLRHTETAI